MGLLSIDLKNAFDTVDHDILSKKLEHLCIQAQELAWLRSSHSNRKPFSAVNGTIS